MGASDQEDVERTRKTGRCKVRKEPSPAKRAEKMRKEPCFKEEKQTLLYHANRTKFRSH